MGELKGFYFSLDAMLASMVLLATAMMLMSYPTESGSSSKPVALDQLHTSVVQNASDWNNSIDYSGSVLAYISKIYHENPSEVDSICGDYFQTERQFGIYFMNSTDRGSLICGNDLVSNENNLVVEETPVPDIKVKSGFKGPYIAQMVMKN